MEELVALLVRRALVVAVEQLVRRLLDWLLASRVVAPSAVTL